MNPSTFDIVQDNYEMENISYIKYMTMKILKA